MNLPNLLSAFRLVLVPLFARVYFLPDPNAHTWAALIYALAFLTDILDGWIARHFNMVTRLGRMLDPLADKLMTLTVIVCVALDGVIPLWAIAVFLCKELAMVLGGAILVRRVGDVITANWWGKISTGVFFVVLALLVLFPIPRPWSTAMITLALATAIAAFLRYGVDFLKILRK